jgi:hypothetical protein
MTKNISVFFNFELPEKAALADQASVPVNSLLDQARAALSNGQGELAKTLLDESEEKLKPELFELIKRQSLLIEISAGISNLSGDYQKSISDYKEAAALCLAIDPEEAMRLTEKAADVMKERLRFFPNSAPPAPTQ